VVGSLQRLVFTLAADYRGEPLGGSNFAFVDVTAPVEGAFVSTYEIGNFHDFAADNDIGWLNLSVPPRVVLFLDRANTVSARLVNNSGEAAQSTVSLRFVDASGAVLDGLPGIVSPEPVQVPAGGRDYSFEITPQAARVLAEGQSSGSVNGVLETSTAGSVSTSVADVYLVPAAEITASSSNGVVVDADLADIRDAAGQPAFEFGYRDLWQGAVPDDAFDTDIGVRGYMTYDETALYLGLEITDDYVSCGRSADEINAHWLTDAIEIGIDRRQFNEPGDREARIPPQGTGDTALFTSRTFKVGIFPCTRGEDGEPVWGARAARDADADQGLVNVTDSEQELREDKAPGFEVSVGETDASGGKQGSYTMEVKIPWDAVPSRAPDGGAMPGPGAGDRVSVNVLAYEYDEADIPGTTGGRRLGWASVRGDQQAVPYIWPEVALQ
jgi:hypothetical protein